MPVDQLPLTSVTADSLLQELIARLSVKFPDWTDNQDSNNMIMLLEAISMVSEMNFAYINRMAREAFIMQALDPRNVFAHARGLGYTPRWQTPSYVSAVIQSSTIVTADTEIPAGTQFNTILPGIVYETTEPVVIRAGATLSDEVLMKQWVSYTDNATGTGAANQMYDLNNYPVMPDEVAVTVNGVGWTFVKNFVDSLATDTHYTTYTNSNGVCTVIFGNGATGKKPPVNANIQMAYKTGGGSKGVIGAQQLTNAISDVNDAGSGQPLSLTGVNALAAVPGGDVETMDQVRYHAVDNLRVPQALLTLDDIESAVTQIPGVQVAQAVNWKTLSSLPRQMIEVFIVPVGGGQPSDQLKSDVNTLLTVTKPVVLGHEIVVMGPTYRTMNYNIQLNVSTGYTQVSVQNVIRQALINMYDPAYDPVNGYSGFKPEFGMGIYTSVQIAILQQLAGVRNLAILSPADTQLAVNEFPVLGTVTFS